MIADTEVSRRKRPRRDPCCRSTRRLSMWASAYRRCPKAVLLFGPSAPILLRAEPAPSRKRCVSAGLPGAMTIDLISSSSLVAKEIRKKRRDIGIAAPRTMVSADDTIKQDPSRPAGWPTRQLDLRRDTNLPLGAIGRLWVRRCHSTTLSARRTNVAGTSRPIDLAVFRLIASTSFVGCSIGMSAGATPLSAFPTSSTQILR